MKIRRLPSHLVDQIAAGEVVERPASVVKELVENALDAGASRVRVELEAGGVASIVVNDDGEGMSPEDAVLAVERHATSKLRALEDLLAITSFGFRGEALPSIASVSKLTLVTRRRGDAEGTCVVTGAEGPRRSPTGAAVGTTVTVKDLFFNVPARRKFLKATATESAHVGEVVLFAALARPDVTFQLVRDGKLARELLRAPSHEERTRQVFPHDELVACGREKDGVRLRALLSKPERARTGAQGLHLIVNGRPVRDHRLARAIAQAYGSTLEPGRYPVGVVYIDLPPGEVDVNVHPQKAEVRFARGRALYDAITAALYDELREAFAIPALGPSSRPWMTPPASSRAGFDGAPPSWAPAGPPSWSPGGRDSAPPASFASPEETGWGALFAPQPAPVRDDGPLFVAERGFYAGLRYLGQVRATLLVCEGDDALYLIDQHAAAERVTFHRLRASYMNGTIAAQKLLVPEIVELGELEAATLAEEAERAASLGLEVRLAGPRSIAVHSVPQLLVRASPSRLVRDLAEEIGRSGGRGFAGAVDLALATMACHGSLRAGEAVTGEEVRALLEALDAVDFAGHCPHGRPVVARVALGEILHRVGR
ncbi:MAG: DNA mismatch repair endonuclease MutL [Myxococcales bacterium]|nr:DNA mismatch repair endonuclease MutL [Myxococcales bacterium]